MTVMKTAESFQATYVATSGPKTVSLLKENQDDLRQDVVPVLLYFNNIFFFVG